MRDNDFEFKSSELSCFTLETTVANHYRIGGVISSSLSPLLKTGNIGRNNIHGENGRVECNISITDISKSETEHEYSYRVSCVEVVHSRRKL